MDDDCASSTASLNLFSALNAYEAATKGWDTQFLFIMRKIFKLTVMREILIKYLFVILLSYLLYKSD